MTKRMVFFGHHKAGSSWLNAMFWNLFADKGIRYKVFEFFEKKDENWLSNVRENQIIGVGISNATASDVSKFEGFDQLLHVVRDPRDMVISAYYSHRDSHPLFPGLAEERALLQKSDYAEGLKIVIDGIMSKTFKEMQDWPLHLTKNLKFEDVKSDFSIISGEINKGSAMNSMTQKRSFLSSLINQSMVRAGTGNPFAHKNDIVWSEPRLNFHLNRYKRKREKEKKKALRSGETPHYRSGKSGQWQQGMPDEVQAHFSKRFPGLVEKYQY